MNFSPFFAGREGLAASASLAPSFSGAGVAAPNAPGPKKSEIERMRPIRVDFLNLDFIGPQNQKARSLDPSRKTSDTPSKFKENLNFLDSK
jgi:hypothetical protein